MVSPKAVRDTGDQVHTRPVGSGPFMIKDYVAKDHTTMVKNPGLHAEGAVERPERPRAPRGRGVEVHPRGGDPRDHARERRNAGHLSRARPVAAPPGEEHGPARREDAVARRAAHLAPQHDEAALRRRAGPPRRQPRRRQGGVPGHGVPRHRPQGLRPAHRRHARRPRRCARPIPSIPRRRRRSSARRGGSPAPTAFARRAVSGSSSC